MVAKRVVILGIFLILVVEVFTGITAVVVHNNSKKTRNESISTQMKMVTQICQYTDHQSECQHSLGPVAKNNKANFKDYMKAALFAVSEHAQKSLNVTESLLVNAKEGSRVKRSIEECKDLMKEVIAELDAVTSYVGDAELSSMQDRVLEMKIRIGRVISYAGTCMDVIGDDDPKVLEALKGPMDNTTAITDNALAIVGEIPSILGMFGVKLNENTANTRGRRLLGEKDIKPSRKLMVK